jgi:hypothetical protein
MTLWSRRPRHVYLSGFLVNGIGLVLWAAWGPGTPVSLVLTQVFCFALAGAAWSALEVILQRASRRRTFVGRCSRSPTWRPAWP